MKDSKVLPVTIIIDRKRLEKSLGKKLVINTDVKFTNNVSEMLMKLLDEEITNFTHFEVHIIG